MLAAVCKINSLKNIYSQPVFVMSADLNDIENQQRAYVESVFKQLERRLFLFAFKITKSEITARDIIQDVFLKLWEQRDSLAQIENIEAFLYKATKNKAIDFLRALANDDKLRSGYFSSIPLADEFTQKEISRREFSELLDAAVKDLPAQRGLIFQMSQLDGYSRKEIAEIMNISESTVKNQLTSALASVRNFLKINLKSLFFFF
jgi:RNA polymerase sigma-70 factor (ECF subfamily)